MKLIRIFLFFCLIQGVFFSVCIYSQVNIEGYRSRQMPSPNSLDFSWGTIQGVTYSQSRQLNYRYDSQDLHYRVLVIAEWQNSLYQDQTLTNDGLVHLRGMLRLNPNLEWEQFTQKQWSETQNLSDRELIGMGVRWTLLSSNQPHNETLLAVGAGVMLEAETYVHTQPRPVLMRFTNYISCKYPIEAVVLGSTTYFQPVVDRLDDYRILSRNNLTVNLSKSFFLNFYLNFDYGNLNFFQSSQLVSKSGMTLGVNF